MGEKDDEEGKSPLTQEGAAQALDAVYRAVVQGIPKVSKPVDKFADDYIRRHRTRRGRRTTSCAGRWPSAGRPAS